MSSPRKRCTLISPKSSVLPKTRYSPCFSKNQALANRQWTQRQSQNSTYKLPKTARSSVRSLSGQSDSFAARVRSNVEFPTRRKERNHICLSLLPRSQGLSEFLTHSCSTWRDKDTFSSGLTKKRSASQSRLTVREQGARSCHRIPILIITV